MSRPLLILLLADTSGHPPPVRPFPDSQIQGPIVVREGSSSDLLACAKAWSEARGYGGIVTSAGDNPV